MEINICFKILKMPFAFAIQPVLHQIDVLTINHSSTVKKETNAQKNEQQFEQCLDRNHHEKWRNTIFP